MKIISRYIETQIRKAGVSHEQDQQTNSIKFTCSKCNSSWVPMLLPGGKYKRGFYKCQECREDHRSP